MENDVLETYLSKLENGEMHYQIEEVSKSADSLLIAEDILHKLKNSNFEITYYSPKDDPIRNYFDFDTHDGSYRTDYTNEKPLCRSWFNDVEKIPTNLKKYGTIIDYECSLIKKQRDKRNIDLVSYDGKDFYLWEVKGTGTIDKDAGKIIYTSGKSLLRAILEIETYYQTLVKNNNLENFKETVGKHLFNIESRSKAGVKKVVVVPIGSKEFEQINNETLMEIARILDVEVVSYDPVQPLIDENKLIGKQKKTL